MIFGTEARQQRGLEGVTLMKLLVLLAVLSLVGISCSGDPVPTGPQGERELQARQSPGEAQLLSDQLAPTPAPTPTPEPSPSPAPTPTPAPTATPEPSPSPAPTPTPASTPTLEPTPTPTPTPAPTPTPTPVPDLPPSQPAFTFELKELLAKYKQNKVIANTQFRFVENALHPVTITGFIAEIEQFYVKIHSEPGQIFAMDGDLKCHYADTRAALHITRDQQVTVTGRISGVDGIFNNIVMFMCDVHGMELQKNPTLAAAQTRNSVVRVHCEPGNALINSLLGVAYGTGVIVDREQGLVLTAHHVVEDCGRIAVEPLSGNGRIAATLVKHCASVDQAYVRIAREELSHIDAPQIYSASAPAQRDQPVYFWAWGSEGLRWQSGIVESAFFHSYSTGIGAFSESGPTGTDAYAVPGDSGSPVFNEFGHLLGILTTGNQSDVANYEAWDCKPS